MRREERVTVQGPVKEQQPDGMSHRGQGYIGRGEVPPPLGCPAYGQPLSLTVSARLNGIPEHGRHWRHHCRVPSSLAFIIMVAVQISNLSDPRTPGAANNNNAHNAHQPRRRQMWLEFEGVLTSPWQKQCNWPIPTDSVICMANAHDQHTRDTGGKRAWLSCHCGPVSRAAVMSLPISQFFGTAPPPPPQGAPSTLRNKRVFSVYPAFVSAQAH